MSIRDNVRERRRERIQKLLEEMQAGEGAKTAEAVEPIDTPKAYNASDMETETTIAPPIPRETSPSPIMPSHEPDPELWWKEKQRMMKYEKKNQWAGMQGLAPTSRAPDPRLAPNRNGLSAWVRGLAIRIVIAGLLLGTVWGWTRLALPGSGAAKLWLIDAVSNEMDFQAIEAWYSDTFGGSPSFLPFSVSRVETKEVNAALQRDNTVIPVQGRLIETFEQSGSGVQLAAPGGSDVVAVYAGRVLQVQPEGEGGVTILVEHPNRVLSVYGNLGGAAVKDNDWVEAGDKLGVLKRAAGAGGESSLYFAVQQDGNTLNPVDVIPLD